MSDIESRHWLIKDMHLFQYDSTITHRYLHNNKSNPTFFPYSVKHGKYRNHTSVSSSKWAIIQQTLAQCNNIQHQATDAKWKTKRMSETLRWCMRNASPLIWPDFWLMKSTIGNAKCVCVCVHVVSHLHWGKKKKKIFNWGMLHTDSIYGGRIIWLYSNINSCFSPMDSL